MWRHDGARRAVVEYLDHQSDIDLHV